MWQRCGDTLVQQESCWLHTVQRKLIRFTSSYLLSWGVYHNKGGSDLAFLPSSVLLSPDQRQQYLDRMSAEVTVEMEELKEAK